MTGTLNINSDYILSVRSETDWGIYLSSKEDLGQGYATFGSSDYPYFAGRKTGSGNNETAWDVKFLPVGYYYAQLAESGIGAVDNLVFQLTTPAPITHKECVSGECQNVVGEGADTCTTVGVYCGTEPIQKELVTNLTTNEDLVRVAVSLSSGGASTYISKRTEGNNTAFLFEFEGQPDYTEMGAGAGLAKFLAANIHLVASVLAGIGIVTIVWLWRDVETAVPEAQATISTNDTASIQGILDNSNLTAEQKTALITEILKKSYAGGTDWGTTLLYGVGLLVAGYVIVNMMNRKR